jgi:hypothetical protein
MTKLTLVSAALIAVAALTTQAAVARSDVAAHHAMASAKAGAADCVRAPNVGAFASAPYTEPPCLPNGTN